MNKRILFLHGLEAGINGAKGLYLRKTFKNCFTPDLEVSKFKLSLKNSFIRILFQNKILNMSLFLTLITFLFVYKHFGLVNSLITSSIQLISILFLLKNYLLRNTINKAVESNVQTAFSSITSYKPDLIIGSSWGGAIATILLERKLWNGPTILIAPAYYAVNKIIRNDNKHLIYEFKLSNLKNLNGKVLVYHSTKDEVIPFNDSVKLCSSEIENNALVELRIIEDDDHGLNSIIRKPYILKDDIEKLF